MSAVRQQVLDCQLCGRPLTRWQQYSLAIGLDRKKDQMILCYSCHDLIYSFNAGD